MNKSFYSEHVDPSIRTQDPGLCSATRRPVALRNAMACPLINELNDPKSGLPFSSILNRPLVEF